MSHLSGVRFPGEPVTRTCPACRRTISALVEHPASQCPAERAGARAVENALILVGTAVQGVGSRIVAAFQGLTRSMDRVDSSSQFVLQPWQEDVLHAMLAAGNDPAPRYELWRGRK